jgi:F-type H+-transporting ATPase subunit b
MNFNLTLLGQSISFFVFIWICRHYIWPHFINVLEDRRKKIADGLEAAERAGKDLELAQARASEQLKKAKVDASGIIDQANKRASQIVDEAKEQAREEGRRLIVGAQAEIEQEVNRAKEHLRKQVASIAIAGAEKILEASIDEKIHAEMTEKLAASL